MAGIEILVLGGTAEGRRLASELSAVQGLSVTTSLAGRVEDPAQLPGQVRVGGFGGVNGLLAHLIANRVRAVVDATHPFAAEMTHHAAKACEAAKIPLVRVDRPAWTPWRGDVWHEVDTVAAAASLADSLGRRLLVTVGRQEASAFADVAAWCLIRCVEEPEGPLPVRCQVLLDRGPFMLPDEQRLLAEHRIDVLVTKNSGGGSTIAKLWAAREAGIPVVMVTRPRLPPGLHCVPDVEAAIEWLGSVLRGLVGGTADPR